MKTLIKNVSQTVHVFGQFTYVLVCKKVLLRQKCQASLSSFLLYTGNILFRSMSNGNYLFNSASLSLIGENSLVHKLRVMTAVELNLNATYAQHLAVKPVYEKGQYIMGGKLFSS